MKKVTAVLSIIILFGVFVFTPVQYLNAAEIITVWLDKLDENVKKTDGVKFKGTIDGLQEGNKYIIRIQVFEDGGTDYSAPLLKSFTVSE